MRAVGLLVCVWGCSDYGVQNKEPEESTVPEPTTTGPTIVEDTAPTGVPVDTAPPEPTCDGVPLAWAWTGSPPIAVVDDPVDGAGLPFWDPAFQAVGWSTVVLPDRNTPQGSDRAFRSTFTLDALPPGLTLDLQSDDGLWVWVNGTPVGHWGGDWQQEGCVNEHAECLVTTDVPPVDVTALLHVGENVVAARVSNPVANAWFEILPACVSP